MFFSWDTQNNPIRYPPKNGKLHFFERSFLNTEEKTYKLPSFLQPPPVFGPSLIGPHADPRVHDATPVLLVGSQAVEHGLGHHLCWHPLDDAEWPCSRLDQLIVLIKSHFRTACRHFHNGGEWPELFPRIPKMT